MSQGHGREWSQRSQRASGRPVNPGACPKGRQRWQAGWRREPFETLNKRAVAVSLSPPGVEYSLSEGRLCSVQLNHSSKYGFREVSEWSLHRDPEGRLPSSLWCVQ